MTDTPNTHLRHLLERFHSVAVRKFSKLTDIYDRHEVEPEKPEDNRAVAQCHTAGRSILTHVTSLRKALLDGAVDDAAAQAAPGEIDEAELQAIIADARENV